MKKIVGAILCIYLAYVPAFGIAASYELIPSWRRVDKLPSGARYIYGVFYVNNKIRRMSHCFAVYDEKDKSLSLDCGVVINLDWKLPTSSNVKSTMVGRYDAFIDDDDTIPFGLWQINEATGDWQFCLDGNIAGRSNCVSSTAP